MMHRLTLITVVVVFCASSALVRAAEKQEVNVGPVLQNVTKLQARISLESKNDFDIDNEKSVNTENVTTFIESKQPVQNNSSLPIKKNKIKRLKKERSERKLSNLWSMFLPGSSSAASDSSDYEESVVNDEIGVGGQQDGEITNTSNSNSSTASSDKNHKPQSESSTNLDEKHDERLVAKYSRPPRQDGNSAGEVSVTSTPSGATTLAPQMSNEEKLLTGTLITGSLSTGTMVPSVNDNINGTSTTTTSTTTTSPVELIGERENDEKPPQTKNNRTVSGESSSNFERWLNRIQFQEPTTEAPKIALASGRPTLLSADRRGSNREETLPPNVRADIMKLSNASAGQEAQRGSLNGKRHQNYYGEQLDREAESLAELRHSQRQQLYNHGQRFRTSPVTQRSGTTPVQQQQQQQMRVMEGFNHYQQPFPQHQQHFSKQNSQAQLIQGIKYPMAQASTISVSTQDGNSNTSLSFTPNSVQLPVSAMNEISPLVMGQINELAPAQMAQTEYQSQDEILRQVTSAINFEQQLTSSHRRPQGDNHRKSGEPLGEPGRSSSNEIESNSPDSLAKLFKVGSSVSELVDPASSFSTTLSPVSTTMSPMELLKANMSRNNSSTGSGAGNNNLLGTDDLDKNFDMLAEKLRSFVVQHSSAQQTTPQPPSSGGGGSQPTWLRAAVVNQVNKDLLQMGNAASASSNLTSQLTGLMNSTTSSGSGLPMSSSNLERLRDLLSKHEKSKNELKSSQATMNLLLQQLMQADNDKLQANNQPQQQQQPRQNVYPTIGGSQTVAAGGHSQLVRGEQGVAAGVSQQQAALERAQISAVNGATNLGWTPLSNNAALMAAAAAAAAGLHPPVSPANLIKNRVRQPMPIKLSQMMDNIGTGPADYVAAANGGGGGDYFTNELAMMLSNAHPPEEASELLANHKILGVPVALLNTEEEQQQQEVEQAAQLEAAAKHLARHNRQHLIQAHNKIAQRLAAPPSSSATGQPQGEHHPHHQHHHLAQIETLKNSYPLQVLANGEAGSLIGPFGNAAGNLHHHHHHHHHQQQPQPHQQLIARGALTPLDHEQYHHHQQHGHLQLPAASQYASLLHEHPHQESPFAAAYGHNHNTLAEPMLPETIEKQSVGDLVQPAGKQVDQYATAKLTPPVTSNNANLVQQEHEQTVQQQQQQQVGGQQVSQAGQSSSASVAADTTGAQAAKAKDELHSNRPTTVAVTSQQQHQRAPTGAGLQQNGLYGLQAGQSYRSTRPAGAGRLGQEMSQLVGSQRVAPMVMNSNHAATPIRYREVSIYRPFGYHSHHTLAYQASPAVAALFPGLAQGSPRPSLLRHRAPLFRSRFQPAIDNISQLGTNNINNNNRLMGPLFGYQTTTI